MEIENLSTQPPKLPIWATIPLYIIACFLFIGLLSAVLLMPFSLFPESDSIYYTISHKFTLSFASMAGVWICAVIFLKYIDLRPVGELGMSIKGRWKDCFAGIAFAAVLYAIGFTISLALGAVEVTDIIPNIAALTGTFLVYFVAAAMEEIMIRGYIQGRLMTKMNKFLAMVIASLIFSAMHLPNPNIGIFPLFNLFLAGLLLGASYLYTRNLWFPIFLHTAWNWLQGSVLGYEVSGIKVFPSLLQLRLPEENLINGGHFGFEGSIICTILMIIGTALIIGWYERR